MSEGSFSVLVSSGQITEPGVFDQRGSWDIFSSGLLDPRVGVTDVSSGVSSFTREEQGFTDRLVSTYLDLIPHNELFSRIKSYEEEFKKPSKKFYKDWLKGTVLSDPKTIDWAVSYRSIYDNREQDSRG